MGLSDKPCVKCGSTERCPPKKGKNLGQCKKCTAEYCEANREKRRAYGAEYREANREKENARYAKWREENLEKEKARNAKWRKENPEKKETCRVNYRAALAGADGTHTVDEWRIILDHYGNACLKCGATENITKDHIVAINNGGSNWANNLQPLCASCNSAKRDYHSTDYRPNLGVELWQQVPLALNGVRLWD